MTSLDTQQFLRTVDNAQHQGFAKGTWAPTTRDLLELHVPQRPDRHHRPPRSRHHQRARSRARAGRQPLRRQLHARVRQPAVRDRRINKHNGEVSDFSAIREPRNDVIFQRRRFPDARRRAARRLRPGPPRPARHPGVRGALRYERRPAHLQGRGGVVAERQLPRHDLRRRALTIDLEPLPRRRRHGADIAGATGSTWTACRSTPNPSDFGGFIRTIDALPTGRASTRLRQPTATARSRRPSSARG